jgi:pyridoxal biosynthesis lyase PdxS
LQYHRYMNTNTTKLGRKTAALAPAKKSARIATRLVQEPMVIGKRRLTDAQRRVILDAMLKAA